MQTNTSQSPNTSPSPEIGMLTQRVETLTNDTGWYDRWKDRVDILSVALLAVAFVLGFVGNRLGARLNKANKDLIATKEQLSALQIATVEANAQTEAKRVEGEAGKKIEGARAEAGVKVEEARAEAARKVGEVQKDVALQQERAAKAEAALLKLQERIKDRHLVGSKRGLFVTTLRDGPKGKVEMHCVVTAPESCTFAEEIRDALGAAGWSATFFPMMNLIKNPVGLELVVREPKSEPSHASVIRQAFRIAGIPWEDKTRPDMPADMVLINVGTKP